QVFVFCPPLEQAPDHTVSRLLLMVSVIDVPVVNEAAPEVPTTTLMPAGVEVTRSPLRPVAVTVSVDVDCAGVTVSDAVRVTLPAFAVIVTGVLVATVDVAMGNLALNEPAGTVTLAGRLATAALVLDSDTAAPPDGAPDVSATVPVEPLPPTTLAGFALTEDIAGGEGGAVPSVSFVTNASAQKIRRSPLKTRSRAPAVVGKSDDNVCPVRYSAPSVPRAMALAPSDFVPPRKVE